MFFSDFSADDALIEEMRAQYGESLPGTKPFEPSTTMAMTLMPSKTQPGVMVPTSSPDAITVEAGTDWGGAADKFLNFATQAYASFNQAQKAQFDAKAAAIKAKERQAKAAGYVTTHPPPSFPIDWKLILVGGVAAVVVAGVVFKVMKKGK